MGITKRYTVYVMLPGINPRDVYIAQTTDDPIEVVLRDNEAVNPKTPPKPRGEMLPLTLRLALAGDHNVFISQQEAIDYRKVITQLAER